MQKIYFSTPAGNQVCGLLAIPPEASSIVVMSHGFTSRKDSKIYAELQEMLNKAGIGALRYDYYGHGESDGKFEDITLSNSLRSLSCAVDFVRKRGEYDIGLFGASFGGLLSLVVASIDDKIKAVALKSPVTDPVKFWRNRLEDERIAQWEKEGVLHYDDLGEKFDLKYGFWKDLQEHDVADAAGRIACPMLIVHGSADTVVPISQSRELAEKTGAQLKVIERANHAYSNPEHYEECKRVMVDFLAEQLRQQS